MALAYSFCCSTEWKDSETEAIKDIIADSITVEKMMQLYSLMDQYKKGRVWMDIYCRLIGTMVGEESGESKSPHEAC